MAPTQTTEQTESFGNVPTPNKKMRVNTGENLVGNGKHEKIIKFLQAVFDMSVQEGYVNQVDKLVPVINFRNPQELQKCFNFEVSDKPVGDEDLLEICQKVFDLSVKTSHPHFFNQLYAGIDAYGFAGSIITDVLNSSIYTYEITPVFTLMEQSVIKQVCDIIGYEQGDGTFSPGGSYSNMLGLNLARFNKFPTIKEVGMRCLPRMVAFTNEQCHYSNKKNAALLGIGTNDLISVRADSLGRMDVAHLQQCIDEALAENAVPFCVIATSGTTVLGAYDPLNKIADICEKHNIWMHVDAAWGGGILFSKKHKHLCYGINRSDSVAWNMHKQAMAPLQCCMFVTKHPKALSGAHSLHVPYLFQLDKTLYDPIMDVGKKVVQCGRKVDVFKFWLMWKALGKVGMENRINKVFDNARYLTELVKNHPHFRLLQEPECTNVCFWFIPKSMRQMKFDLSDEAFCKRLAGIAPKVKERMTLEGSMLVGYQPIGKLPNFFRMVVINDKTTYEDMQHVVDTIEKLGEDL